MTTSLALVTPGQHGEIASIGGSRSMRTRLMELGLLPGTHIEVLRRAPLGDPLQILARGGRLSIRRADAARLTVRLHETPQPASRACPGCAA